MSRNSLEAIFLKQKSIMKTPQQEFPNVPSKMLPKLVLTFTSVDSQISFLTHSNDRKSLISHTTELYLPVFLSYKMKYFPVAYCLFAHSVK